MEISLALVADAANREESGKLNVLGVFDQVYSDKFPYRHPEMFVVVRFTANPSEFGKKKEIEVCLLDPDGNVVGARLTAKGQVPVPEAGGRASIEMLLRMVNVPFERPGRYAVSILVAGEEKASIPLEVLERKRRKKG